MQVKISKNLFFVLLYIFLITSFIYSNEKKIQLAVFPFKNKGKVDIEYFGEIIQRSLFTYFKYLNEYKVLTPDDIKQILISNNNDDDYKMRFSGIQRIIKGSYDERDGILEIEVEIIDNVNNKTLYKEVHKGTGGVFLLDTIENIAKVIVEHFIGKKLYFGKLTITGDHELQVYLDEDQIKLPYSDKITAGSHFIKAIYQGKNIYQENITINKSGLKSIHINLFSNLEITANYECQVYINDKYMGTTPFIGQIVSGDNHKLLIAYKNHNKEEIIHDRVFSTNNQKNNSMYFEVPLGKINITGQDGLFFTSINSKHELLLTPVIYDRLFPGTYKIYGYINDKQKAKKYFLFKKKYKIEPFEHINLDLDNIKYKRMIGLGFIPSASQFYHRQPVKAGFILGGISTTLITAAFSPLISWAYYQLEYKKKADLWNSYGEDSGYTREEIDQIYSNIDYIFYGILAAGLSSSFIIWLISLIDGVYTSNYIHKLKYSGKTKKLKVSFFLKFQ